MTTFGSAKNHFYKLLDAGAGLVKDGVNNLSNGLEKRARDGLAVVQYASIVASGAWVLGFGMSSFPATFVAVAGYRTYLGVSEYFQSATPEEKEKIMKKLNDELTRSIKSWNNARNLVFEVKWKKATAEQAMKKTVGSSIHEKVYLLRNKLLLPMDYSSFCNALNLYFLEEEKDNRESKHSISVEKAAFLDLLLDDNIRNSNNFANAVVYIFNASLLTEKTDNIFNLRKKCYENIQQLQETNNILMLYVHFRSVIQIISTNVNDNGGIKKENAERLIYIVSMWLSDVSESVGPILCAFMLTTTLNRIGEKFYAESAKEEARFSELMLDEIHHAMLIAYMAASHAKHFTYWWRDKRYHKCIKAMITPLSHLHYIYFGQYMNSPYATQDSPLLEVYRKYFGDTPEMELCLNYEETYIVPNDLRELREKWMCSRNLDTILKFKNKVLHIKR